MRDSSKLTGLPEKAPRRMNSDKQATPKKAKSGWLWSVIALVVIALAVGVYFLFIK